MAFFYRSYCHTSENSGGFTHLKAFLNVVIESCESLFVDEVDAQLGQRGVVAVGSECISGT